MTNICSHVSYRLVVSRLAHDPVDRSVSPVLAVAMVDCTRRPCSITPSKPQSIMPTRIFGSACMPVNRFNRWRVSRQQRRPLPLLPSCRTRSAMRCASVRCHSRCIRYVRRTSFTFGYLSTLRRVRLCPLPRRRVVRHTRTVVFV